MSFFDPIHVENLDLTLPDARDTFLKAQQANPLFFDEPIRSSAVAQMLQMTPAALQSLHHRGYGPDFTVPPNTRQRLYTRRSALTWLYSGDPSASRTLKRILREVQT